MSKSFILHDCDTGSDDAIALMMLIAQKNVVPVAITCVQGNTKITDVGINNLRILKLYNMEDKIPVYLGCQSSLVPITLPEHATHVHGEDGLGGQPNFYPPASNELLNKLKEEHAVNAMIRLSKEYAGKLKIVATGPLTNLAMAVRLDPDFPSRLSEIYIMGGTSHGKGNTTPAGEFNFVYDPEAAYITLQAFSKKCKVILVTYEFTMSHFLSFSLYDEWLNSAKTKKSSFAKMLLTPLYNWSMNQKKKDGVNICDAYVMAIALDPTIATKPRTERVSVELSGHHCRGQLVTDHFFLVDDFFEVTCFESFDRSKFVKMLKKSLEDH